MIFYTWWHPPFLIILLISTITNYIFGTVLNHSFENRFLKKTILVLGLSFNIGLIFYYKYIDFVITNLNWALGTDISLQHPLLPLAISFFTFQKISYLIDGYREGRFRYSFSEYCFFVCFFPQLIAGPIVQHKDIIPQIPNIKTTARLMHIGICYFVLGLAKKVIIADHCAEYANPLFNAAGDGVILSFGEAWLAAIAYTLQLYFDFSGYSDMALGLGRMFNIKLPINFNSPYQAVNIIDFWRRWHMTLSLFLRNYLYIPLGGNRSGTFKQFINIMMTMLIGGLWHGANWTFVIWGGMHGCYLIINHSWHSLVNRFKALHFASSFILNKFTSRALTFVAVVVAWVYFRAESVTQANHMVESMLGLNGISLMKSLSSYCDPSIFTSSKIYFNGLFPNVLVDGKMGSIMMVLIGIGAFMLPNTHKLLTYYQNNKNFSLEPRFSILAINKTAYSALVIGLLGAISVLFISKASEFLYFQF